MHIKNYENDNKKVINLMFHKQQDEDEEDENENENDFSRLLLMG